MRARVALAVAASDAEFCDSECDVDKSVEPDCSKDAVAESLPGVGDSEAVCEGVATCVAVKVGGGVMVVVADSDAVLLGVSTRVSLSVDVGDGVGGGVIVVVSEGVGAVSVSLIATVSDIEGESVKVNTTEPVGVGGYV